MIHKLKSVNNTNNTDTSHIIIYVIVLILFLIVLYNINLRSKYSIQYEWWNTYNGKNYDRYLNLTNMLLARESRILYLITRFFDSNLYNSLTAEQIDFLFNFVMPFIYMQVGKETTGFVLPRHLTKDIKFENGENTDFDKWRETKIPGKILSTSDPLEYDSDGNRTNLGVYPRPEKKDFWKFKFRDWGITKWTTDQYKNEVPDLTDDMLKAWFDTSVSGNADNFLAKYNILPNSPLCISFINGSYNAGSLILDSQSLSKLIGGTSGDSEGGWIGYLQGLGSNEFDRYANFMFSSYAYKDKPPTPPNKCNSGSAGSWASAVGSGLGLAAMGAFFPAAEGATFALAGLGPIGWFFIAAGLGVGIASSPIANQNC